MVVVAGCGSCGGVAVVVMGDLPSVSSPPAVTPTFRCAYVRPAHVCVRVGVPVVLLLFAIFFVFVSTPKASPPGGLTPCDQYFTEAGMCTVEDYARNVTQATSLFVSEQPVPYCCGLSCAKPSYTGNVPAELLYNSFCATPGAVDTDGQCPAHGCTTTLFPDWYEGGLLLTRCFLEVKSPSFRP